ncbi:MAG TPA: cytochrome c [Planctomycetota bacterium]|nr:cytochrome c [Planctomycetota bacterium]
MPTPSRPSRRKPLAVAGLAAVLLLAAFATPSRSGAAPAAAPQDDAPPAAELPLRDWPISAAAARGRAAYLENCVGCHGPEGEGDGPAAAFLNPLPRNFQVNKFKFRSTRAGDLPTDDDLLRTITYGLPGSSMPGFPLLHESKRRDLVQYVLHLAAYGEGRALARRRMMEEEIGLDELRKQLPDVVAKVRREFFDARKTIEVPPEPAETAESLALGKRLFLKSCAACHGETGRGDGPSSNSLRDWRDAEIRARDFTSGVFRAGDSGRDLFLRLRTGIAGTPMPAFSEPDDELWAIVHYVRSLKRPGAVPVTRRMGRIPGAEK